MMGMKLYNLYEDVILEHVDESKILEAINNKVMANIMYVDKEGEPPTKRYVQIYRLGKSKANNPVISAYQIGGGTTTAAPGWKLFRLDRITDIQLTKMRWHKPIEMHGGNAPAFNQNSDGNMVGNTTSVNFDNEKKKTWFKNSPMLDAPDDNNFQSGR